MSIHALVASIALCMAFLPLQAQDTCTFVLSGYVIDDHDNTPLPYANIYIPSTGKGAVSDSAGFYRIEGICRGTYLVQCSHLGCETVTATLDIDSHRSFNFRPEHHAAELDPFSIVAQTDKPELVMRINSVDPRTAGEIKGEDLSSQLARVPGVTTLTSGAGITKPVIHGLHSSRLLILNNGIRHEAQQWGGEHAPEIDPESGGRLSVIKGAGGLRYGPDAIAGVVVVDPYPWDLNPGVASSLTLASFSNGRQGMASGNVTGSFRKVPGFAWRLQGSGKRGGNLHAPQYYLGNTGLSELNFSAATAYHREKAGLEVFYSQFNARNGILSAAHAESLPELMETIENGRPASDPGFTYRIEQPFLLSAHELLKAGGYLKTGKVSQLKFNVARQYNLRQEYDHHAGHTDHGEEEDHEEEEEPALQLELTTHSSELLWEHEVGKRLKGTAGTTYALQRNTHEGHFLIPNYRKNSLGFFLIEQMRISRKVAVEAGARYDFISQQVFIRDHEEIFSNVHEHDGFSGSAGVLFSASPQLRIRLNESLAWRLPAVNELYADGVHHGAAAVEQGNASLSPEFSWSTMAVFEYQSDKFLIEVEPYFNLIHDFIYLQADSLPVYTVRGAFPSYHYDQTDALLTGVDFMSRINVTGPFDIEIRAALVRGFDQSKGSPLPLMPADRIGGAITYNFNDGNRFNASYVSLQADQVFKQTRVPEESELVDAPPGYFLLHLRGGFLLKAGSRTIGISAAVSNMLNTTYRSYLNRFRFYADEPGLNASLKISIPITQKKTSVQ